MKEVSNTKSTKKGTKVTKVFSYFSIFLRAFFVGFVFKIFVKNRHGIHSHAQTH